MYENFGFLCPFTMTRFSITAARRITIPIGNYNKIMNFFYNTQGYVLSFCPLNCIMFFLYLRYVFFTQKDLHLQISQLTFTRSKSTIETLQIVCNMFKVNYKNTKTTLTLNIFHTFF